MGKRRSVAVLSSPAPSDEDCRGGGGGGSSVRDRPMIELASRKRRRGGSSKKAATVSASRQRRTYDKLEEVTFDKLDDDFSECLHEIHIYAGSQTMEQKALWVDKHKPHSLEDLAVHKKKVDEVKSWMECIMKNPKEKFGGNLVLLITGPAGVGKSTVVDIIASQIGAELCEWRTPTPTLWQEHVHSGNLELCYMSKLDEFECFVEKVSKYSLLRLSDGGGSRRPVILLIDDLPLTNGRAAFIRLSNCLTNLVHWAQVPTVVLMTECCKNDSGDSLTNHWEELESSILKAGASKISFNFITQNAIKKTLSRISSREKLNISSESIDRIAKSSCGDIRHAIASLQYSCLGPDIVSPRTLSCEMKSSSPSCLLLPSNNGEEIGRIPFSFGKDETVALFHALGKFLHNKREIKDESSLGAGPVIKAMYTRHPLKMDVPEIILSQAHCQPRPIADFLHENVLDFVSDEAIDDAWLVLSYLSEADHLLSASPRSIYSRSTGDKHEFDGMTQSVAASVAVRGVLFGNSHPSQQRWHSIRSPKLWQTDRLSKLNKNQILNDRFDGRLCEVAEIATEYRPHAAWLGTRMSVVDSGHEKLSPHLLNAPDLPEGSIAESEEDEIEEC